MNKVVMIGRNVKDCEVKQTSSGTSVVEFSIAVKRSFKSASGEYESDFFNCVAYKNVADLIGKYVKKGDMIGIDGRLQTRNYTNREGRKVYVTEIICENIEFLQSKKQDGQPTQHTDPFAGAKFEEVAPDEDLPL